MKMMTNHIEFGHYLLDTYDLDPLYVILASVSWPERVMKTFLLAYWVFYSAGVAAKIAEAENPYHMMFSLDAQHASRGHERRHMRGQQFEDTVNGLRKFGSPEKVVDYMINGFDFKTIAKNVQAFWGFGQWMAFKVADMAERVLQLSVDFSNAEIGVYKDPIKGAALIGFGDQHHNITRDEVHTVFRGLQIGFNDRLAPPYLDRVVNIQELETICCKWKSHVNGHYPIGCDTFEIYHGLQGCGDLAQELQVKLKPYKTYIEEVYDVKH